jgi:hypothetical protein
VAWDREGEEDRSGLTKGWRGTLGGGKDDGPKVERAIRDQLDQAEIVKVGSTRHEGAPDRISRKWTLAIPRFEVARRRPALVLTVCAQDPGEEYTHLVTTVARP